MSGTATHDATPSHVVSPTISSTTAAATATQSLIYDPQPIVLVAPDETPLTTAAMAAAVGAAVGGGGGAIGEAVTLAALSMLTCGGQVAWSSNSGLQRLLISVFYDLGPSLAVVGNVGLMVLCFGAQWGAVRAVAAYRSGGWGKATPSAMREAAVLLRYPSYSHALLCFLCPGALFAAAHAFASVNGDGAMGLGVGVVGIVLCGCGLLASMRHARRNVWPHAATEPTDELFEEHLPRPVVRWLGWALPRTMWVPKDHKLQHSTFFSSVSEARLLPLQPLLQYHGCVFSLVAGLPFPAAACAAQYTALVVWTAVPLVVVVALRLRVFRRPLSNPLGVATYVLTMALLLCTAVYFQGPARMREGAVGWRAVCGWLLTIVSVLKAVCTVAVMLVERVAATSRNAGRGTAITDAWRRISDLDDGCATPTWNPTDACSSPIHLQHKCGCQCKMCVARRASIAQTAQLTKLDQSIGAAAHSIVCVRRRPPTPQEVAVNLDLLVSRIALERRQRRR